MLATLVTKWTLKGRYCCLYAEPGSNTAARTPRRSHPFAALYRADECAVPHTQPQPLQARGGDRGAPFAAEVVEDARRACVHRLGRPEGPSDADGARAPLGRAGAVAHGELPVTAVVPHRDLDRHQRGHPDRGAQRARLPSV
eukprot:4100961-Prymnesium_polylepis.1